MKNLKEIRETRQYDVFKKLEGNRDVDEKRVRRIKESIKNVGYVTSPIIVNEKMEVIDGQGRLEALRQLDLPVEYIVSNGVGIKECIAMNINQTNWSHMDYIKSYAKRGVKSYELLLDLIKKYPYAGLDCISTALFQTSRFWYKQLHNGDLAITDEEYKKAIERLEYTNKFLPWKDKINQFSCLMKSVLFCYDMEEVDKERLFQKITFGVDSKTLMPFSNLVECLKSVEEIYNKNKKGKSVWIYTIYRQTLEDKYITYKYQYPTDTSNKVLEWRTANDS